MPIGRIEDEHLVLEVRFTHAEAPFVGHALRREYDWVVECLASLAKVLAHREAQVTARMKEMVDAEWAQLTARGGNDWEARPLAIGSRYQIICCALCSGGWTRTAPRCCRLP